MSDRLSSADFERWLDATASCLSAPALMFLHSSATLLAVPRTYLTVVRTLIFSSTLTAPEMILT